MTTPTSQPPAWRPDDAHVPPPRRAWLTWVLCAVIFLGGGVVGAGFTTLHVTRQAQEVVKHPDLLPQRLTHRLTGALDLDQAQSRRVQQIVERRYKRIQKAREDLLVLVGPELESIRREIQPLLTREQGRNMERLFKRFRDDIGPPRVSDQQ